MNLQQGDTVKIYQYNTETSKELLLASFSQSTTCKSNPQSCGQVIGRYSKFNITIRLVFESSGGTRTPQDDPIWIDTVYLVQEKKLPNSPRHRCPALNGAMPPQLMCEPGDRVHCPATYESPVTPEQTKPTTALAQGSSWSGYADTFIWKGYIFPTTLQPAPTALVPLVASENYFANYTTSKLFLPKFSAGWRVLLIYTFQFSWTFFVGNRSACLARRNLHIEPEHCASCTANYAWTNPMRKVFVILIYALTLLLAPTTKDILSTCILSKYELELWEGYNENKLGRITASMH